MYQMPKFWLQKTFPLRHPSLWSWALRKRAVRNRDLNCLLVSNHSFWPVYIYEISIQKVALFWKKVVPFTLYNSATAISLLYSGQASNGPGTGFTSSFNIFNASVILNDVRSCISNIPDTGTALKIAMHLVTLAVSPNGAMHHTGIRISKRFYARDILLGFLLFPLFIDKFSKWIQDSSKMSSTTQP